MQLKSLAMVRRLLTRAAPTSPAPGPAVPLREAVAGLRLLEEHGVTMASGHLWKVSASAEQAAGLIHGQRLRAPLLVSVGTEKPSRVTSLVDLQSAVGLYTGLAMSGGPAGVALTALKGMYESGTRVRPYSSKTDRSRLEAYQDCAAGTFRDIHTADGSKRFCHLDSQSMAALNYYFGSADAREVDLSLAGALNRLDQEGWRFSGVHGGSQMSVYDSYDHLKRYQVLPLLAYPPQGVAFPVNAALLADSDKLQARGNEVQRLCRDNVLPAGMELSMAPAFFSAVYEGCDGEPVDRVATALLLLWKAERSQGQDSSTALTNAGVQLRNFRYQRRHCQFDILEASRDLAFLNQQQAASGSEIAIRDLNEMQQTDPKQYEKMRRPLVALTASMRPFDLDEYRQLRKLLQDWSRPLGDCDIQVMKEMVRDGAPVTTAMLRLDSITRHIPAGEDAAAMYARFLRVADALTSIGHRNRTMEVFSAFQKFISERDLDEPQREEAEAHLLKQLVLNHNVSDAVGRLCAWKPAAPGGTVENGDTEVTIGGVRVAKNLSASIFPDPCATVET